MVDILEVRKKDQVICSRCEYCSSMSFRMKGLLGRDSLDIGSGILLRPCNSIHMFFMKFAIDAIFLNKKNQVVRIYHSIKPWRMTPVIFSAYSTLEMEAGVCHDFGLQEGDQLELHFLSKS
ncbi:MAG: DUF192 domain-containing protein [Verrucomicrobiota bacterium]